MSPQCWKDWVMNLWCNYHSGRLIWELGVWRADSPLSSPTYVHHTWWSVSWTRMMFGLCVLTAQELMSPNAPKDAPWEHCLTWRLWSTWALGYLTLHSDQLWASLRAAVERKMSMVTSSSSWLWSRVRLGWQGWARNAPLQSCSPFLCLVVSCSRDAGDCHTKKCTLFYMIIGRYMFFFEWVKIYVNI